VIGEDKYVEAVVNAFFRAGGQFIISPADYQRVLRWRERGIPLRVVEQAVREYSRHLRGPDGRPVRHPSSLRGLERLVFKHFREHGARMTGSNEPEEDP
jgi:hypothetical protein